MIFEQRMQRADNDDMKRGHGAQKPKRRRRESEVSRLYTHKNSELYTKSLKPILIRGKLGKSNSELHFNH